MNIYTGLLFQQGYIQNPELALSLAQDADDAQAGSQTATQAGERRPGSNAYRLGALASFLNELMSPPR